MFLFLYSTVLAQDGKCFRKNRQVVSVTSLALPTSTAVPATTSTLYSEQPKPTPQFEQQKNPAPESSAAGWIDIFRGENSEGIGSYYHANVGSDSTNGHSWCGFPYKDHSNGFAISLSAMTHQGSLPWEEAGKKYCGLEAKVTNKATGISKIMYVIDAFDDAWIRSPGSLDIMAHAWSSLTLRDANDKNAVIPKGDLVWQWTGGRSDKYKFKGEGDP